MAFACACHSVTRPFFADAGPGVSADPLLILITAIERETETNSAAFWVFFRKGAAEEIQKWQTGVKKREPSSSSRVVSKYETLSFTKPLPLWNQSGQLDFSTKC